MSDFIWFWANGLGDFLLFLWEWFDLSCIYVQNLCNVFAQYLSPKVIYFAYLSGKGF